jgi:hypothetical protein
MHATKQVNKLLFMWPNFWNTTKLQLPSGAAAFDVSGVTDTLGTLFPDTSSTATSWCVALVGVVHSCAGDARMQADHARKHNTTHAMHAQPPHTGSARSRT